jgi:hypothetical protein
MKVIFTPEVEDYLYDLVEILYVKGYFSFYENAERYVSKLIEDIQQNINKRQKKPAPLRFRRYGSYYVMYKPNKHTTWYIFFNYKDDRYLTRYITNNHISAQYFKGSK